MRVAIYCRVSTDKEDQLNSLEYQKQMFLGKIEKDGDVLYNIYFDEGLSGTSFDKRDGFNEMLMAAGIDVEEYIQPKLLKNGNQDKRVKRKVTNYLESDREPLFNLIYIKNTSRFARNTLSYEIVKILRKKGVHIYFLEQDINTKNLTQDFMFQLFQVFDANDSRDKSSKVLSGQKQSFKNNVIHTNKSIYGYDYIKETNSLKQIPEEAEIVKTIFELYAQGYGARQIINILNEKKMFNRKGKSFGKTTINRILANEKYFGGNPVRKYDTGVVFAKESYPKVRDEYEVKLNDRIEAIVSEELFNKCKSIRESRQGSQKGVYVGTSKFASKVICVKCKSFYISDKEKRKTGVYEFYRCKGKKQNGVSFCSSRNVKKSELEEKLQTDIKDKKLEKAYELALKQLHYQLEYLDSIYNVDNSQKLKKYKVAIIDLTKEIKDAFREYSAGNLLKEIYADIVNEDNKKIAYYKEEIAKLEAPLEQLQLRKDVVNIRIDNIKKKLNKKFTENDYLEYASFLVLDKYVATQYNIPEMKFETTEALKLIKEKHNITG